MKKSDFYYELPERLIAQTPLQSRDESRLLYLGKSTGEMRHVAFRTLTEILTDKDLLILNDTKVIPARLLSKRIPDGADVEFVLLTPHGINRYEALAGPGKKAKPGAIFMCGNLEIAVESVLENGNRLVSLQYDGDFYEMLRRVGEMPLPHYIKEKLSDDSRYQTVYAKVNGSAAAPTAGLHFTEELLDTLRNRGVGIGFVTLHVGVGTFRPVKCENVEEHVMHSEWYEIPGCTAEMIAETKVRGGRVIAVGTTSCRTLESAYDTTGRLIQSKGNTSIFIYPPYEFKVINGLITNFHLPESTLIMLVSALAGRENILSAYNEAVKKEYRFFSFGDAMLIL